MAAPKGNKNAKGKKVGRKSAYEEKQTAQWHAEKWEIDTDIPELKSKIESGKYSVRDMFLAKALQGVPRILAIFADKILPNISMLIGPNGGPIQIDLVGEAKKRSKKYE